MAETPKTTQLRDYYASLHALKEDEQMELARFHAERPDRLVNRFLKSVEEAGARAPIVVPFHESARQDPSGSGPVPPAEIKSTIQFVTQVADGDGVEVHGVSGLDFSYVDREIFPGRTGVKKGGWTKRTLDLLLVSDEGRPIVGELKRGGDSLPYFALIQALMHAAELLSAGQRERLATVYPETGFKFGEEGPWVDVYVIAYDIPDGANRDPSLALAKDIASRLVADERIAALIGRIAFIEARPDGERLGFSCDTASTFP